MTNYPKNLIAFQRRFADEASCARWLFDLRWPDGFRCPECDHDKAWALKTKPHTFECRKCHRQTSVKAGTIMHGSKLPLTIWFWAAWLMGTHSNGMSALQLQGQLGLGSYKTAWLLEAKLRRAMVDPDRNPLKDMVEVDEASMPYHRKDEPPSGGQGRSKQGKMMLAGAVEALKDEECEWISGRIRLAVIEGYGTQDLHPFIEQNIAPGSTIKTDGSSSYPGAPGVTLEQHTIGPMAAHVLLPLIHRMISNLKTWAKGVYHGLHPEHLQSYFDEYVFRHNRRRNRPSGFRSLLKIAMRRTPMTYDMLIAPEPTG